jgi:hypothetical protein
MKRLMMSIGVALVGLLLGFGAGRLFADLIPACGEDCSAQKLVTMFAWGLGSAVVFGSCAFLWMKPQRQVASGMLITSGGLSLLLYTCASVLLISKLYAQNEYLTTIAEIQPSTDFSKIVVAKQDIQIFENNGSTELSRLFMMKTGERCATGAELNELNPARIEIQCKRGSGVILKSDVSMLIVVTSRSPE